MKTTKKLFSLLLALVLTVALCAPAFAEESGSITINNAETGATYTAYKIFDMTYDNSGSTTKVSYTYTKVDDDLFKALETLFTLEQIGDTDTYNVTDYDSVSATQIATLLHSNYETLKKLSDEAQIVKATATESGGTAVFSGIDQGYYYITKPVGDEPPVEIGSIVAITSTDLDVDVYDKIVKTPADQTGFKKEVLNAEGGTAITGSSYNVGDPVYFKITVPTTNWAEQDGVTKQIEKYTVTDDMDSTLTYDKESLKIEIYKYDDTKEDWVLHTDLTPASPKSASMEWVIQWIDSEGESIYPNGARIVISYTATVNATAAETQGATMNNTVSTKWTFVDGTEDDNPGTDPTVDPKTYGFTIHKVDNSDPEKANPVPDAAFKLYKESDETSGTAKKDLNGNTIYVEEINVIKVTPATGTAYYRIALTDETAAESIEVDNNGLAEIHGLQGKADSTSAAAKYYLEEVVTPEGYNKLNGLQLVELETSYKAEGVNVVNNTGTVLPGTGGMGTTILTVVGLSIMVVAAVLLITKKRVEGKEED